MATTKKRINISVPADIEDTLIILAKRDAVPVATKAGELLREIIEIEEDSILSQVAESRDTKGAAFISHEEAWKKLTA